MRLIGSFIALSFGVGVAGAGSLYVNNASFETLPTAGLTATCGIALGCSYSYGAEIPGWTIAHGQQATGEFDPGTAAGNHGYFNYVPDGTTVAYTNDGMIYQTLSATVAPGILYTLMVDVGLRNDGFPGAPIVRLMIGNTPVVATGVTPTSGMWSTYTAMYTGLAADAGQTLTIQLASSTPQGDFDNVRLYTSTPEPGPFPYTSTPEPGTLMMVLGFGAILPVVRRLRRSRA